MLSRLIAKEILEHLMNLKFAVACVLCFVVIMCSLFVRYQDYAQTLAAHHEDSAIERANQSKMDHPWQIVWQGLRVHHGPNPLKIFVRGVEEDNGCTVLLPCQSPPHFEAADLGNAMLPLFPSIDLVIFAGIIMSLLAVVFGYDAVCGEKERGTLRLMLSYPLPRDTVLLGKWIGGYAALTIPFLLAVLAGAAMVLALPAVALSAVQWMQFGLVCGMALLYIAAVFSASLWISSVTSRPATSIMILVTLWMVFVLAVPNLSPYIAQALAPTMDPEEVLTAQNEQADAIWKETVEEAMRRYDREHGFGKQWWKDINWSVWEERQRGVQRRLYEIERESAAMQQQLRMFQQSRERFNHELNRQVVLSRWISRLSPFACFAMTATEITDTGLNYKRRLLDQLRRHQAELCAYGWDEWRALEQTQLDNEGRRAGPWHQNRRRPIPRFVYEPPAGSDFLRMLLLDGGILAGMTVVFFMLSYVSFLRYDVR